MKKGTKRKVAFTLAEVLITLGIIGVVSAITIPTLIQNYKKHEATSRLKKFYSAMSQAVLLSENDNGPVFGWREGNNGDIQDENGDYDHNAQADFSWNYWTKYLAPYIKYTKAEKGIYDEENPDKFYETKVWLADGTTFTLHNGGTMDVNVDINGEKQPNEAGRDQFGFMINTQEKIWGKKHFSATYQYWNRDTAQNECKNKQNPLMSCGRLLEIDNFEFKSDYPFKL